MEDDEEFYNSLTERAKQDWQYHEICQWLPYKPETIDEIAQNMTAKGYRQDRPIVVFEGAILDGRHRYEAAIKANVDPIFVEFEGSREEAIDYVTSENVARRHLSNPEKEFFYVQRAEALGVRTKADNQHVKNFTSTPPSQEDHAEALGVTRRTVANWEDTRKEIKADPELSEKAKTFEGFKEAKKEVKERRVARKIVVPDYNVSEAMGALSGMAWLYAKEYEGTPEEAASILFGELIKGCERDEISMSIARDRIKWFLEFKQALDLAEPAMLDFLDEKPDLKIVN